MNIKIKHFTELSIDELHDLLAVRNAVFVVGQNCCYQDLDGNDKNAFHLLLSDKNKIVGTLRILNFKVKYQEPSIGRVAISSLYRGKGLGHLMMKEAMSFIKNTFNTSNVRISAQSYLVDYYTQHGFSKVSKEYLEDGLPHVEMLSA